MQYKVLWQKIKEGEKYININLLDEEVQSCLLNEGDNVANHYDKRAKFLFLERQGNEVLVLEFPKTEKVNMFTAINCSGGYGTDILGSYLDRISNEIGNYLTNSFPTNDEYSSIDRYNLVNNILNLISEYTETDNEEWDITFTSTGTEAMDFALQLIMLEGYDYLNDSFRNKNKNIIISCYGAWHGWGLNPNQLLDRKQFTRGLPRYTQNYEVVFMHYGNLDNLYYIFKKYQGRIKAVVLEGLLGDGGVIVADDKWWNELFKLSKNEDAIILDDEVFTGFRCGNILAIPKGLQPDCITLGKALGGSLFPISAVIWKKNKLNLRAGIGVRTFNARPFQAKVVNKILSVINDEKLFKHSQVVGTYFYNKLNSIIKQNNFVFKDARGKGLFIGLELSNKFAKKGSLIRDELLKKGVLTEIESGQLGLHIKKELRVNQTIRIAPPLSISKNEIDIVCNRIIETIDDITMKYKDVK